MENNYNEKIKYYDLTIPQENIWLIEQLHQNTNINNIYGTLFINKPLDLEVLKKAINKIIENNDALRIRIDEQNSRPVQYVQNYEYEDIPVYFVDDNEETKINTIVETVGLEHINPINNKLYDFRIIYNPNYAYICVKMHHIIADAWSMAQLFVHQVDQFYTEAENNIISEKRPSYLNYIQKNEQYKNSEKYLRDEKFWEKYVKNLSCTNEFEIVKDKRCQRIVKALDNELYTKIDNFCKKNNISEYSFFLGVISIYFSKLFSTENIVIGSPFLNRKKSDKEFDTMGMFIATLPISVNVSPELNFIELCKQINSTNLSCFKHSSFPYSEIQKKYSETFDENINLYEIAFSYQINNLENVMDPEIYKNTWVPNGFQTNPLLVSYVNHFGEHQLCYDYLLKCFETVDIDNIHERIICIISQILKNSQTRLENIKIISEQDIELLKTFNNTGDTEPISDTIVSRFEKIVKKNKSKIALKYNDIEVTYGQLDRKSNSVANYIIKQKIKKGSPISIIFDKSIEMFISMLGILKAGCYYIPILPEEEQKRAEFIVQDSASSLLITEEKYSMKISNQIVENKLIITDMLNEDTTAPEVNIKPNDLCYIIYTSGSTGKPKGVMIKHENVISLVSSMDADEDFKFLENDIAISLLKYSFDASAIDIYSSLLNAGKLIIIPKEAELDPEKVVEIMHHENVTRTFTVHKWIEQIQNVSISKRISLKNLRLIGTGAEVLKPQNFQNLLKANRNLALFNTYGPTETIMFITKHKITNSDIENNFSPIGDLIPFSRAVVLNSNNEVLPPNSKGELTVFEDSTSIKNVSNGYLNLDWLTNERFIRFVNPCTGRLVNGYKTGDFVKINNNLELEFLGRKDAFVKVNGGYFVSLNEVEAKIQNILGNSIEICVVSVPIRNVNTIILYIVKKDDSINVKLDDIQNEINNNITFYMRPKKIIELDNLPLNKNGKTNRKLLQEQALELLNENHEFVKPVNKTEQAIYDTVKEIVNCEFSTTDDFEDDLGIDSLNMTILYSKLSNNKISLQDLYTYPTIKDLAYMLKKEYPVEDNISADNIKILNASSQMNLENILLTGATGFVGVNLLKEFALNKSTQKIYCIVRQKLNLNSNERFDKIIHNYFDEETCEKIKAKTVVLNGDLRKEFLGLDENTYSKVFKEVQTIVNAAANVKHFGKYHTFFVDNVETVNNLIKTCTEFGLSLAHISTLSLNGYLNENVTEKFTENTLNINQHFNKNPYLISKYEAEQSILKSISEKNLNAKIFRIGNIMPRISDGVFQMNFDQNGFILAINTLQKIQAATPDMLNQKLYLTPVDQCCECIFKILNSDYSNTIYHIENDKAIKVSSMINILKERDIQFDTDISQNSFNRKLSAIYSAGAEYLNYALNNTENKYSNTITLEILNKLDFEWQQPKKEYLENIVNISMKIK